MAFVQDAWGQSPIHGATDSLPGLYAGHPSTQETLGPSHLRLSQGRESRLRNRTPEQAVAELTFLEPAQQAQRRTALGLDAEPCAMFLEECEFVSLGCFCQVTNAIHALGLKRFSYPLDWCRSSMRGIVSLLNTNFEGFFDVGRPIDRGESGTCCTAKWGGSFWHHRVDQEKTRADFKVRIGRFCGRCEVPQNKTRVFVRACNGTAELYDARKLHRSLRQAVPGSYVLLLLILDLQNVKRLQVLRVSIWPEDILIGRISGELFDDMTQWSAEKHVEAYAEAIAMAARYWSAGDYTPEVVEVDSPEKLMVCANPYHGGSPCYDTYWPQCVTDHEFMDEAAPQEDSSPYFGSLFWCCRASHQCGVGAQAPRR